MGTFVAESMRDFPDALLTFSLCSQMCTYVERTRAVSLGDFGPHIDISGGVKPEILTNDCYQTTIIAGFILSKSLVMPNQHITILVTNRFSTRNNGIR